MIPLPVYTEAALLTLEAGRVPVFPDDGWVVDHTDPDVDDFIYQDLLWESFQREFPEMFDQDCGDVA